MSKEHLDKLHSIPFNWSSMSSFKYNKDRWFENFIMGVRASSREMTFGSWADKKIQDDPSFLPSLPRYELMQHKMTVMFDGLMLMGTPDGIDLKAEQKKLYDFKTGKQPWTQKRAKEHGQLLMYLLLIYITEKIKPEEFECGIHWMPTQDNGDFTISFVDDIENNIQTFKVKHTMRDILKFGQEIKKTYREMEQYLATKE